MQKNLENELKKKNNSPYRDKLAKTIRELDITEEIIENADEKPLPELPMEEHLNPNRNPTKNEMEMIRVINFFLSFLLKK